MSPPTAEKARITHNQVRVLADFLGIAPPFDDSVVFSTPSVVRLTVKAAPEVVVFGFSNLNSEECSSRRLPFW